MTTGARLPVGALGTITAVHALQRVVSVLFEEHGLWEMSFVVAYNHLEKHDAAKDE